MRAGATTTTDALAERARAFDLGVFERASDRVVRDERATLISTPTLRSVPHLHGVVLHAQMDVGDAEALAGDLLGDLPFRRLLVPDEALVEPLEARGWHHEPVLLLARSGGLAPPPADVLAEEVPYGHVRGLRDEWIRSAPWATGEEPVRDAHEADRRMLAGTPTRAFATFEQGRPLAYALLLDGGRDGMLEDVFTTPAARGRGLASAVCAAVLHAARAERHELVFVPSDADHGAGPLYESLGFEPVTVLRWFRRGSPS
ncbi:MAG TPA: GNAT family N-acetyltransferase [Solirubrobacteraceae bacterium]|nr:GNAT family N-acetyltransferase [Solirubrobacteraceae bacterium]